MSATTPLPEPDPATSRAHPAVTTVADQPSWPRTFALAYADDFGRLWRAGFTFHTAGAALFSLEHANPDGLIGPPVVGWLSWARGEVVVAWRDTRSDQHGGAVLRDAAPGDDDAFDTGELDTQRWQLLARRVHDCVLTATRDDRRDGAPGS